MASEGERAARMIMSRVAEPGDVDAARLVREFTAEALLARLRGGRLPGPKAAGWAARLDGADADAMARQADRVAARFIMPGDQEWPGELMDLRRVEAADGDRRGSEPLGLWIRGALSPAAFAGSAVAVVGARAPTAYGEHVAGELAAGCASRGRVVVSGGAYGIDVAAHRGALAAGGSTAAVLACGIDRMYPTGHTRLLTEIAERGLVVSEAAPGCPPSRSRFLVRNRLIAALSQGTVVVEAALRSGSLNTARWARDIGHVVMGVPGPVTSMMSTGVHELLRQPETVLVTAADEVLELVSPIGEAPAARREGPVGARDRLDAESRRLLEAVPKQAAAPVGSIATLAEQPPAEALGRLATLLGLGLVERVDGGWRLAPDAPRS